MCYRTISARGIARTLSGPQHLTASSSICAQSILRCFMVRSNSSGVIRRDGISTTLLSDLKIDPLPVRTGGGSSLSASMVIICTQHRNIIRKEKKKRARDFSRAVLFPLSIRFLDTDCKSLTRLHFNSDTFDFLLWCLTFRIGEIIQLRFSSTI